MGLNVKTLSDGGIVVDTKLWYKKRRVAKGTILVKVKYGRQKPKWTLMSLEEYNTKLRSKEDEGSECVASRGN